MYKRQSPGSGEQLLYILHPEGMAVNENGTFAYKYNLTDYMGNVRTYAVSYTHLDVYKRQPDNSALIKNIENNMNYYDGTLQIQIPLYTLKEFDLEVPISLMYKTCLLYTSRRATSSRSFRRQRRRFRHPIPTSPTRPPTRR